MRVLVIDDSRSMRAILSRILHDVGAEVDEAPDGRAAIERLELGPLPDLALVDWHMPVMNGLEFVAAAHGRPEWRSMSIMMVTTESEQEQVVRALVAGAHEYLIKPFTPEALREKLSLLGIVSPRPTSDAGDAPATEPPGG